MNFAKILFLYLSYAKVKIKASKFNKCIRTHLFCVRTRTQATTAKIVAISIEMAYYSTRHDFRLARKPSAKRRKKI